MISPSVGSFSLSVGAGFSLASPSKKRVSKRRTGIGARALGPEPQGPSRVHARQRASACAHGVNVEHGHGHGQLGDDGLIRRAQFALQQRDVGGGAAHIERDDAAETAEFRDVLRAKNPASRAGKNRAHRLAGGHARRNDSAARLHDAHLRASPTRGMPLDVGEVEPRVVLLSHGEDDSRQWFADQIRARRRRFAAHPPRPRSTGPRDCSAPVSVIESSSLQ